MSSQINSLVQPYPTGAFQVKMTIPECTLKKCDNYSCRYSIKDCKTINIMPISIQCDNNFEIRGDYFLHLNKEDYQFIVKGYLVLYKRAKCWIIQDTFLNSIAKRQSEARIIHCVPKTENNANISPELLFEMLISETRTKTLNMESGEILLQIELKNDFEVEYFPKEAENFALAISAQAFAQLDQDKNFKIVCNGEDFHFNKILLALVSEVFQKIVLGNSKEAQENCVEINDFSPDTIRVFQKISFGNETIQPEDLSVDLLMFANRYLMDSLETKCKNYLVQVLETNRNNLLDLIKVAYDIEDANLLKIGAKYFSRYKDELKESEELKRFKKSYPDCMFRMYELILYDETK